MSTASRRALWGAAVALAGLFAVSIGIRSKALAGTDGAPNLEATYHVLLTVTALRETPARDHYWLPTVSLGRPNDKWIKWGTTLPTPKGERIYVSFTAPTFLAPYVALRTLRIPFTLRAIIGFNVALHIVACIFAFVLLLELGRVAGIASPRREVAALVGASIQVLSAEALLSYGAVYWAQELYQLLMLASLIVLTRLLHGSGAHDRWWRPVFVMLAFLGAWTEWTGVVFNAGAAAILMWNGRRHDVPAHRRLAVWTAVATAGAVVFAIAHAGMAVGFGALYDELATRLAVRGVKLGSTRDFLDSYRASYGLLLAIVPLALGAIVWQRRGVSDPRALVPWLILLAAVIPLAENLLLLQHATQFSFERLKAIVPMAVIVAVASWRLSPRWAALLAAAVALSLGQNWRQYQATLATRASWAETDRANRELIARVRKEVNLECAIIGTNDAVRGYLVMLLHRSAREKIRTWTFMSLMRQRKHCGGVYLVTDTKFIDMPEIHYAIVYGDGWPKMLVAR